MADIPIPTDPLANDVDIADVSTPSVPISAAATLDVSSPSPLDVSAATVDVSSPSPLDVSAATVDVNSPSPLDVSAATVDVNSPSPLDASAAVVSTDASDTVPQSVETTSTGPDLAASLVTPFHRYSVGYDTSGSATITVEGSIDGTNWFQINSASPGSATTGVISGETGFEYVRAYIDQNVNRVVLGVKGV